MKSYILSLGLVVLSLTSITAEAKTSSRGSAPSTVTAAESRHPAGESSTRFGFGFASYGGGALGGANAVGGFVQPALSGWLDLNHLMSLQFLAAINSSDPFAFAIGGVFRYTLHGSQADGFHGGVGFNLGTTPTATSTSTFFFNLFPLVGYHFALSAASNIQLSFDGGPVLAITPSPFQFRMNSLSPLLGVALHYFF